MGQSPCLVVTDIINFLRVAVVEAENHPPVGANADGVKAFQFTFQRVQTKPRQVHVRNAAGGGKPRQNITKLADVFGVYAAWVVVLMQAFQSLVANRPDHYSAT